MTTSNSYEQESASLKNHALALAASPDYRVIERLPPRTHYSDSCVDGLLRGVILDVESTGTDITTDQIVELGMILFEFCPSTGKVHRILGQFNELEDPGMPIPPEATRVNGITDAMVSGHKISDDDVSAFLNGADILIAHNAGYDRAMLERRFDFLEMYSWGCSLRQVDWAAEGFGSQKLDYLAFRLGFFYDAHRAITDCFALLEALQRPLPSTGEPALLQIISKCPSVDFRIWALDAKFDKKDTLKKRGYRWGDGANGTEKAWHIDVPASEYSAEVDWLKQAVYANKSFRLAVDTIDAFNRFSVRAGSRRYEYI